MYIYIKVTSAKTLSGSSRFFWMSDREIFLKQASYLILHTIGTNVLSGSRFLCTQLSEVDFYSSFMKLEGFIKHNKIKNKYPE